MGGGAAWIGGLQEFCEAYVDFGLGMRFYDRFLQIRLDGSMDKTFRPTRLVAPEGPADLGF